MSICCGSCSQHETIERLRAEQAALQPIVGAAFAYADSTADPTDTPHEGALLDAVNDYRMLLGAAVSTPPKRQTGSEILARLKTLDAEAEANPDPNPLGEPRQFVSTPAAEPSRIRAPFTPAQQDALNAFQRDGRMHPFTCPDHSDLPLLAERHWRCLECDYTQYWAHAFMAETPDWPVVNPPTGLMADLRAELAEEREAVAAVTTPAEACTRCGRPMNPQHAGFWAGPDAPRHGNCANYTEESTP